MSFSGFSVRIAYHTFGNRMEGMTILLIIMGMNAIRSAGGFFIRKGSGVRCGCCSAGTVYLLCRFTLAVFASPASFLAVLMSFRSACTCSFGSFRLNE